MKNRDIPNTKKNKKVLCSRILNHPWLTFQEQEADRTSNSEASHLRIFVQKNRDI